MKRMHKTSDSLCVRNGNVLMTDGSLRQVPVFVQGGRIAAIGEDKSVAREIDAVGQRFGKDLATASRVCSRNPARLLGLNKGEIAIGRDADLVILDDDLPVRYTLAAGMVVYQVNGA